MTRIRIRISALLVLGLILGLSSHALAQVTYIEPLVGGCFLNTSSGNTECASATFSLMTGGTGGGTAVLNGSSGTVSDVTGLQIVIQNTTTGQQSYGNNDLRPCGSVGVQPPTLRIGSRSFSCG